MTEFKPDEIMLQNYIQNKLSPNDTEQLELWLVDHPEVMQDLEMDIMFKQADFNPNQQQAEIKKTPFSFLDFFTSKKLLPLHALAYVLVGFFIFNLIANQNSHSDHSAATFIELEKQRGIETTELTYTHNVENGVAIRFFPDSINESYKMVLKPIESKQQIVFDKLKVDENGSITVMLNASDDLTNKWQVEIYNSTNKLEQNYIINLN